MKTEISYSEKLRRKKLPGRDYWCQKIMAYCDEVSERRKNLKTRQ